jgi:hypothetical protein
LIFVDIRQIPPARSQQTAKNFACTGVLPPNCNFPLAICFEMCYNKSVKNQADSNTLFVYSDEKAWESAHAVMEQ